MLECVHGLLQDRTRRPGKPPLATTVIERVVTLTGSDPPGEATHWTAAAIAKSIGISVRSVSVFGGRMACSPVAYTRLVEGRSASDDVRAKAHGRACVTLVRNGQVAPRAWHMPKSLNGEAGIG